MSKHGAILAEKDDKSESIKQLNLLMHNKERWRREELVQLRCIKFGEKRWNWKLEFGRQVCQCVWLVCVCVAVEEQLQLVFKALNLARQLLSSFFQCCFSLSCPGVYHSHRTEGPLNCSVGLVWMWMWMDVCVCRKCPRTQGQEERGVARIGHRHQSTSPSVKLCLLFDRKRGKEETASRKKTLLTSTPACETRDKP